MTIDLVLGALYVFFGLSMYFSFKKRSLIERVLRKNSHGPSKEKRHKKPNRLQDWLNRSYIDIGVFDFVLSMIVFSGIFFTVSMTFSHNILISLFFMLLPVIFVFIFIDLRKKKIQNTRRAQLEPFLETLVGNLYANPNLLTGLTRSISDTSFPLRQEIERIIDDTRRGRLLNDAIKDLIKASDDAMTERVFMGFIASNDKGFDLIEFINLQLDYLRSKQNTDNYIKILSTSPRYTAYIIMAIPVLVIIAVCLINRGFLVLLFSRTGIILLIYASISYLIGILITNKMISSIKNGGV